ncbi:MAG: phosphonoacetaldehyde reductase [Ruminococcaceae bacterium]|nr:phosphonoacetaldehyde reductase [Oscillospiraceae bacterium]
MLDNIQNIQNFKREKSVYNLNQQTFYDFSAFDLIKDKKSLLVCDNAFDCFGIEIPCKTVKFNSFTPNPKYEDILTGVKLLNETNCDCIVAVGGGSSIDTAKAIKYFSGIDNADNDSNSSIDNVNDDLPIMAIPTTSGTGSEATHFAAIYKNGEKYSLADERLLPEYVVLQADMLKTLPLYQKKCTMLDALCQAIESWWSRGATKESIQYSREAVKLILNNMEGYLNNEEFGNKKMLLASNLAGKAINITTTTAPHAMSYKLTTLYGLSHGHAVALCLPKVWKKMKNFSDIASTLGYQNYKEAVAFLEELLQKLEIFPPENVTEEELEILTNSVNAERLSNNPVLFDKETIKNLYKEILEV